MIPGQWQSSQLQQKARFPKTSTKMFDVKAWAESVVEWAAKDPYGVLTTRIWALPPCF